MDSPSSSRQSINGVLKRQSNGPQIASSRLSMGMGNDRDSGTKDVVAVFGEPGADLSDVTFRNHRLKNNNRLFTVNNVGTDEVKHIGTATQSASDGFEYFISFVSRKTQRPVLCRPASVVKFTTKFRPPELFEQVEEEEPDDAPLDVKDELKMAEISNRKRHLAAEFGSLKRNKFLDNVLRRSVDNKTLEAMTPTALHSVNASQPTVTATEETILSLEKKMTPGRRGGARRGRR